MEQSPQTLVVALAQVIEEKPHFAYLLPKILQLVSVSALRPAALLEPTKGEGLLGLLQTTREVEAVGELLRLRSIALEVLVLRV
jgi:hypothetical protein